MGMSGAISLHIDTLVLEGIPDLDRLRIAGAMQVELENLIRSRGLPFVESQNRDGLQIGPLEVQPGLRPEQLGVRLAQAVYQELSR